MESQRSNNGDTFSPKSPYIVSKIYPGIFLKSAIFPVCVSLIESESYVRLLRLVFGNCRSRIWSWSCLLKLISCHGFFSICRNEQVPTDIVLPEQRSEVYISWWIFNPLRGKLVLSGVHLLLPQKSGFYRLLNIHSALSTQSWCKASTSLSAISEEVYF